MVGEVEGEWTAQPGWCRSGPAPSLGVPWEQEAPPSCAQGHPCPGNTSRLVRAGAGLYGRGRTAHSPAGILSAGACMMLTRVGISRVCMGPWQASIWDSSLKTS